MSTPQPRSLTRRILDNAFRDPCCGGMLVIAPVAILVILVRWVLSTGNPWAVSGLAAVGLAAIASTAFALLRRRACCRRTSSPEQDATKDFLIHDRP